MKLFHKTVIGAAVLAVSALAHAETVVITTPAPVVEAPPAHLHMVGPAPVVEGYPGHPRAERVAARIENLEMRIRERARAGDLRPGQAQELRHQLGIVRHNERAFMLDQHLSNSELAQLQHELDRVSYNIGVMVHNNRLPG